MHGQLCWNAESRFAHFYVCVTIPNHIYTVFSVNSKEPAYAESNWRSTKMSLRENEAFLKRLYRSGGNWFYPPPPYFVSESPKLLEMIFSNGFVLYAIFIAEITLLFFLSIRIAKIDVPAAVLCFAGYSISTALLCPSFFLFTLSLALLSSFS
ncbi:MAG: hypothetical protein LBT81_01700 [Helicobacteraceae bacterium]|jgi:hypothetical protein|nr:hypothetical protein [Helicobacteraceae bacterium]